VADAWLTDNPGMGRMAIESRGEKIALIPQGPAQRVSQRHTHEQVTEHQNIIINEMGVRGFGGKGTPYKF